MDTEELIRHRRLKYRSIGGFQEGTPVEPERKRNMKLSDLNAAKAGDLEAELEDLKKKILDAAGPSDPITSEKLEKLKEDVDQEISNAFISMGLQEKLESLQLELSKASDSSDNQTLNLLKEKVDRIMLEFYHNLTRPGAYLGLKQKLEMLNMAHRLIELKEKGEKLKTEINQKVPAEVIAKMEVLKEAQKKLSEGDPFDEELVEEVERAKNELIEVMKSANMEIIYVKNRNIPPPPPDLAENIAKVNEEIVKEIERAINVTGLSEKIVELRAEIAKGSSVETVEKLKAEIQEQIVAVMDVTTLKEEFEKLNVVDLESPEG